MPSTSSSKDCLHAVRPSIKWVEPTSKPWETALAVSTTRGRVSLTITWEVRRLRQGSARFLTVRVIPQPIQLGEQEATA